MASTIGGFDVALQHKLDELRRIIAAYGRLAVAFSAGVDSTLLLAVAHDVLGDDVLAATGKSPSIPAREIAEAEDFCRAAGIRHVVVDTDEFSIEGFEHNPQDRCYHCKRELLSCIARAAAEHGIDIIAEGSNVDDAGDYRPGFAAVTEMRVKSPLREAGMGKADIRALARQLGLAAWDKPAYACLNTRFAYGELLTPERLAMVDAAEQFLHDLGFMQVRVRFEGGSARIEVPPADIAKLASDPLREKTVQALKDAGFNNVSLDLQGYRMGSMNEAIR